MTALTRTQRPCAGLFTVTAQEGWELFSNAPTPVPEPVGGGRAVWRFAPTERISTYITALVAGDYHAVRDTYTAADGHGDPSSATVNMPPVPQAQS